uniref:Outer membrane protein beta-barrel domain-containing protein n=1 Tax=candidate division WOR-3 bacterium TaxID=2052148 RepID=A0A7C4XUX3_UNCW3
MDEGQRKTELSSEIIYLLLAILLPKIFYGLPDSWSQSYCTYDLVQRLDVNEYAIGFGIDNFCLYSKTGDSIAYDERRFDIWAGLGILPKTEIEIKYSYPTAGLFSIKHVFLNKSMRGAIKPGFGYMKGTRSGFITDYVYDFYGTVILERTIFYKIRFLLAPKMVFSIHTRDRQEHSTRPPRYILQYGFGLGTALGERLIFQPETNWLWGNNQGINYIVNQFGIGVNIKI